MGDEKGVTALVPRQDAGSEIDRYAFEPIDWTSAARAAEALFRSGILPASIKTPQAALALVVQGRELGLTMMQAIRGIYVVDGRPSISAQMMIALVQRSGASA